MSFASRLFLEQLFRELVANRVEAFIVRGFRLARSQVGRKALAFPLDVVYLPLRADGDEKFASSGSSI